MPTGNLDGLFDDDTYANLTDQYIDLGPVTNRDDKLERVLPALSCSHCPPNRNENASPSGGRKRMRQSGPREKARTQDRQRGREAKQQQSTD